MWSKLFEEFQSPVKVAESKRKHPKPEDFRCFCGAAGRIWTADLILTKKPSCFLVSTYSCHGIPPNPLRYKGFGVFHCSRHVICFFLILGHFSLFVGRFVGTLLASPTIFFIFYTLLDSSQCPLAREVICRNRHQTVIWSWLILGNNWKCYLSGAKLL